MEIWTLCLKMPPGAVVEITDQASFICNAPKNVTPSLLLVNQQIHDEGKNLLLSQNEFSVRLHEGSCMGQTRNNMDQQCTYAIPSLWNAAFRQQIYHIRHWRIEVLLNHEIEKEGLSLTEATYQLQQTKAEIANIVQSALEELCNALALSDCLSSIHVSLHDQGRKNLKTTREHTILLPLQRLKVLKRVEIKGVPPGFDYYLERRMMTKQAEIPQQ